MATDAPPDISTVLPPLVLGTGTFNSQYVSDPTRMPYTAIVERAFEHGITAFDTSPYYGPSEKLLGHALATLARPRESYFLITKAGRIAASTFDYSPAWIRHSVSRSLRRLHTTYLDLVLLHDVEFVSPDVAAAAMEALLELRRAGTVRYVGISGFPVDTLARYAAHIRTKTGCAPDAVLSYGNCTLQNTQLARPEILQRLSGAGGVRVALNASVLNMGLLTTRGVDAGPQAAWHPSPRGLRDACSVLARECERNGQSIEDVALRFSFENWARRAADGGLGTRVVPAGAVRTGKDAGSRDATRLGTTVIGITSIEQLDETVAQWYAVLEKLGYQITGGSHKEGKGEKTDERYMIDDARLAEILGEWQDYAWPSPPDEWANERKPDEMGTVKPEDME